MPPKGDDPRESEVIKNVIVDPADPPEVVTLLGHAGRSVEEAYVRLHEDPQRLREYLELRRVDVLPVHRASNSEEPGVDVDMASLQARARCENAERCHHPCARRRRETSTSSPMEMVRATGEHRVEKSCEFGMRRGRALWRRFKVHSTPKHASWLNVAEMEASLVAHQCLGKRRIPSCPPCTERFARGALARTSPARRSAGRPRRRQAPALHVPRARLQAVGPLE